MNTWAYGVTTVPERTELLNRTLASLRAGGFAEPHIFVDGAKYVEPPSKLAQTLRFPRVRTAANWYLSLAQLYCTNLDAQRFAIFQDDFVCVRNMRQYLDACEYPERGYWNLLTHPLNQKLAKGIGWFLSNQHGKGAVALVFDRRTVIDLLCSRKLIERFGDKKFGHQAIDGGVVEAMKCIGVYEHCHNPSLVQHTGVVSSMGSRPQPPAESFPGESFDASAMCTTVQSSPSAGSTPI